MEPYEQFFHSWLFFMFHESQIEFLPAGQAGTAGFHHLCALAAGIGNPAAKAKVAAALSSRIKYDMNPSFPPRPPVNNYFPAQTQQENRGAGQGTAPTIAASSHYANVAASQRHSPAIHPLQAQYVRSPGQNKTPQHVQGVHANIVYTGDVPNEVQQAIPYVVRGLGTTFPRNCNRVEIAYEKLEESWEQADTVLVPEQNGVRTVLNSEPDIQRPRGVAYYLLTLTHELFLHAIGDLKFLDETGPYKDQEEDHARIHTPASNSNDYLLAVRQVLATLPNDPNLKKEFLQEYCRDVELYMKDDNGNISDPDHKSWLNQLKQAANVPSHPVWTGNSFSAYVSRQVPMPG